MELETVWSGNIHTPHRGYLLVEPDLIRDAPVLPPHPGGRPREAGKLAAPAVLASLARRPGQWVPIWILQADCAAIASGDAVRNMAARLFRLGRLERMKIKQRTLGRSAYAYREIA